MGILNKYKAQLEENNENENVSSTEGSQLKEEHNNSIDVESIYRAKMAEMRKMSENDMENNKLISDETVEKVIVKHAYCEECGEELISDAPPMFNPFTFERICRKK